MQDFFFKKNYCSNNRLSSDPREFTRLTKPRIALLRIEGVIVVITIDDIILTVLLLLSLEKLMKNVLLVLLRLLSYF